MQPCKCYAKWHDCGETFRKLRTVGRATVHWYVQLAGLTVVVDAYWRPQRACFIWPKNGWKIIRQIRTYGTAPSSPWTPHQIARGSWTLHDFKMTSNDLKNKGGQRGISITIRDGCCQVKSTFKDLSIIHHSMISKAQRLHAAPVHSRKTCTAGEIMHLRFERPPARNGPNMSKHVES